MEFVKRRNKLFFDTIHELISTGIPFEAQIWSHKPYKSYTAMAFAHNPEDLIVINFLDETGTPRNIVIDVPSLLSSRTSGGKALRKWLALYFPKVKQGDRKCYKCAGHIQVMHEC